MLVEALAVVGLDPVSENALENLRKAAEVLRARYGIKLIIIPFNTWSESIDSALKSLPMIFIGGYKAFSGYAPSVEDIVRFVIKHAYEGRNRAADEALIPAGVLENDRLTFSAATA